MSSAGHGPAGDPTPGDPIPEGLAPGDRAPGDLGWGNPTPGAPVLEGPGLAPGNPTPGAPVLEGSGPGLGDRAPGDLGWEGVSSDGSWPGSSGAAGGPEAQVALAVRVNGVQRIAAVEARTTLAELLRGTFGLTGTHLGCEHGVCGACTVLLDGEQARACLVFAWQAHGAAVTTVEGLADGHGAGMGLLQQACWESHSFQCGFCTPGMLIAATDLLARRPDPTEAEVRTALSGNLCRCTGYDSIVAGVLLAAERIRSGACGAGAPTPGPAVVGGDAGSAASAPGATSEVVGAVEGTAR